MVEITSTANEKIKRLVSLQKKRKLRDAEGVFLVEGLRMFREAPGERVREIYVSESFGRREPETVRKKEHESGVHAQMLSDAVFAHVSDTKTPQGALCVVKQARYRAEQMAAGEKPLLLALESLQDPGNLGTIVRAAEGAGVTGILLSRDCVDIYNPKTIRSTMGSVYRMPFAYVDSLTDALTDLKRKKIRCYAAHLDGMSDYDRMDYRQGTAFLIGNEGNGLSEQTAALADCYIRIPMCGQVESLNAAVAASILMFEAFRQRRQ